MFEWQIPIFSGRNSLIKLLTYMFFFWNHSLLVDITYIPMFSPCFPHVFPMFSPCFPRVFPINQRPSWWTPGFPCRCLSYRVHVALLHGLQRRGNRWGPRGRRWYQGAETRIVGGCWWLMVPQKDEKKYWNKYWEKWFSHNNKSMSNMYISLCFFWFGLFTFNAICYMAVNQKDIRDC